MINCRLCGKKFLPYADTKMCPDCYVLYECMINKDNENMKVIDLRKKINATLGTKEAQHERKYFKHFKGFASCNAVNYASGNNRLYAYI